MVNEMNRKLGIQLWRFGITGFMAFLLDIGILYVLTEYFGIYYLAAALVSFVAAVLFQYCMGTKYIFGHREDMKPAAELVVFTVLSAVGLGMNEGIMWLFVEQVNIQYLAAKVLTTGIVMGWNFISRKLFLEAL